MDTLISLGSTAALAYSIYATVAMLPTYYETASAIVTLIAIGKYLETLARGRSNAAIRALIGLQPQTARLRADDGANRSSGSKRSGPAIASSCRRANASRSTDRAREAAVRSTSPR